MNSKTIWVNGRFLTRKITGVERVAGEILSSLSHDYLDDQGRYDHNGHQLHFKLAIENDSSFPVPSFAKGWEIKTVGQRKGLDIALGKPAFVTRIIPETNTVVLGDEEALNQTEMTVTGINWMKYDGVTDGMEATTKIRYKDKGALSNLYQNGNAINVQFYENVKGVAPGQSAVFYEGNDVIGGGVIQRG